MREGLERMLSCNRGCGCRTGAANVIEDDEERWINCEDERR